MIIDLDIARQNIPGGESGLQHMAKMMKSESARLVNELLDSKAKQDTKAFQRAAHTLKSAAAIFGAETIVEASRALETAGKAGDISETQQHVDQLVDLVGNLCAELDGIVR